MKNGEERLVVLNDVAKPVTERQRGLSKEWVLLMTVSGCTG